MARRWLVTGGAGFIGSAVVHRLAADGNAVRVLDNASRGHWSRITGDLLDVEMIEGDIRDRDVVERACAGVHAVCHLAAVNGTELFYRCPETVLDVGVRGILNVVGSMIVQHVRELFVASSSEVYQTPSQVPTDENVPLIIPDPLNPRYSYAGAKLISELIAINFGRRHFDRVVVFRPHNVYGPDMGWEHVIPQLAVRIRQLARAMTGRLAVPVQGTGQETRSFVFIDDMVDALCRVIDRGRHLTIYNLGNEDEVTIATVAAEIGRFYGREIDIVPGPGAAGATPRRCPDIGRIRDLGYRQNVTLRDGLRRTLMWYEQHADERPTT